ncbi:centromere DNA-binding like protein [Nitzschia inconspicua]|uniref:Centromere DNA-binding like protein n=1 Tax=Nitzschia inconspicua TaxID=303405 RepID=A0A9K3Q3W4_9STRA|nr:centromere DNA-binding like protein [Nitzschia inconspicua]
MRANTARSYEPRVEEFKAYCDVVFSGLGPERRYTVTHEKIYPFMFYQCFREKKAPASQGAKIPRFNHDDYIAIHSKYSSLTPDQRVDDPVVCLDLESIMSYKAALQKFHADQRDDNINNCSWQDHVWLAKCEKLMKVVKGRKQRVKRANYDENEMSPYGALDHIDQIENALFHMGCVSDSRSILSSLRNRFTFLFTTGGILRGESVYMAELSDLLHATVHRTRDPHPVTVMILQMATGKTNKDLKLYGRVARHKNVNLCSIGALGFYLMYRFHYTVLSGGQQGTESRESCCIICPAPFGARRAFTGLSEISPEDDKVTATRFLHFMKVLSEVVIQDAAVIFVEHPNRIHHSLFSSVEVFQSNEFQSYVELMRASLTHATSPYNASLETVLPGLNARFDTLQQVQQQLHQNQQYAIQRIDERMDDLRQLFLSSNHLYQNIFVGMWNAAAGYANVRLQQLPVHNGGPAEVHSPSVVMSPDPPKLPNLYYHILATTIHCVSILDRIGKGESKDSILQQFNGFYINDAKGTPSLLVLELQARGILSKQQRNRNPIAVDGGSQEHS